MGMRSILLATRNKHKVEEIKAILGPDFRYSTLDDFPGAPGVIEDAPDFAGNATKKAISLAKWMAAADRIARPEWVLADDSGLEVDALNGAPGVHSARFAALDSGTPGNSPDSENNAKLLRLLEGVPAEKRTARFRCVIALTPVIAESQSNASPVCAADEVELHTERVDGSCEGHIITSPRGGKGFGYDPLFVPAGHKLTFGELGEETKNSMSHRAAALRKLKEKL